MVPFTNSTLRSASLGRIRPGQGKHLVGHVDPVREAGRPDPAGRQQHVDAPARAEVEHFLAGLEISDHHRVAAAQTRGDRLGRQFALLVGAVETSAKGGIDLAAPATARRVGGCRVGTRGCTALIAIKHGERSLACGGHCDRGGGVTGADLFAKIVIVGHGSAPQIDRFRWEQDAPTHR